MRQALWGRLRGTALRARQGYFGSTEASLDSGDELLRHGIEPGGLWPSEAGAGGEGLREVARLIWGGVTAEQAGAGGYLARRGHGAAVLSTALNSNAISVVAGLVIPASLDGRGPVTRPATIT